MSLMPPPSVPASEVAADFDRSVFMMLGLPVDCLTTRQAVLRLDESARQGHPCFLTTPNLNFLIASLRDKAFRDSVIDSDLVIADGMPLVWMARLLDVPLIERVAGSTVVERLQQRREGPPLRVFFFGGQPGVAQKACDVLAREQGGMIGVGHLNPGFGSVEDMSQPDMMETINACRPDIIIVSLGAKKGQAWIAHNRHRLTAPVISHLGAVVNFIAGTVARAPEWMQKTGLEWVWRMYEEPSLFKRYWNDGNAFLRLVWTRAWPCSRHLRRTRDQVARLPPVRVRLEPQPDHVRLVLEGRATLMELAPVRQAFKQVVTPQGQDVVIDLSACAHCDTAFLGLLCILLKHQRRLGRSLRLEGVTGDLHRLFHFHCAEFLLG